MQLGWVESSLYTFDEGRHFDGREKSKQFPSCDMSTTYPWIHQTPLFCYTTLQPKTLTNFFYCVSSIYQLMKLVISLVCLLLGPFSVNYRQFHHYGFFKKKATQGTPSVTLKIPKSHIACVQYLRAYTKSGRESDKLLSDRVT